jgi:predicted DNA-binding WGR domain protein
VRRFELVEGGSSKFWEISVEGASYTVRFGRIGTGGQTQTRTLGGEAEARAAAEKLVAEKTKKGYLEVGAAASEPVAASEPAAPPAAPARAAKAKPRASAGMPDLTVHDETYGARKLVNLAQKLSAIPAGTYHDGEVAQLLRPFAWGAEVVAHLIEHGAVAPDAPVWKTLLAQANVAALSGARALALLVGMDDALARSLPVAAPLLVVRARQADAAAVDAAGPAFAPSIRDVWVLARAAAGEGPSDDDERAAAVRALLASLRYGKSPSLVVGDALAEIEPEALIGRLRDFGGDDWLDRCPDDLLRMIPWPALSTVLAGRPLAVCRRALGGSQDAAVLEASDASAAELFAAADEARAASPNTTEVLILVGLSRAATPDEVPAGLEAQLATDRFLVRGDLGARALAGLGAARLEAWAATVPDEETDALRELWMIGAPFGAATVARLLTPPPFDYDDAAERWAKELADRRLEPRVVPRILPAVVAAAAAASGRAATGLARWAAALVARLPEDAEAPDSVDALLEPAAIPHVSYYKATAGALARLPADRAERVLARSAAGFAAPPPGADVTANTWRELRFFRPRLSDAYVDRVAGILVEHQDEAMMWSDVNHNARAFKREGARIGRAIAARLAGARIPETLLRRVERHLGPDAAEVVRAAAATAESPREEMRRLAAEGAGPRVVIYVLFPTDAPATPDAAAYTGGRPRGIGAEEHPRRHGRKLAHAFTIDLARAPELAARHPGARTLSIFTQAWSESVTRAQALVTRAEAELAADPGELGGARVVEIERLEVPAAVFAPRDQRDRAAAYLAGLIYREAGFLGGGPLWLQDGPAGVDPDFVAQYDERLCANANFGDAGIVYAFADRGLWQCH